MSNREIINKHLDKLREYIKILEDFRKYTFKEFAEDIQVNWSIDRGLQLAIESSIDIGKEIITGLNLTKPDTYKQTFQILAQNKIISHELSEEIQRLAKFRNELIHDYLYLDPKKIYGILQNDLKYFEEYLLTIENYIKKQK